MEQTKDELCRELETLQWEKQVLLELIQKIAEMADVPDEPEAIEAFCQKNGYTKELMFASIAGRVRGTIMGFFKAEVIRRQP